MSSAAAAVPGPGRTKAFLRLVMIEHSVFALPFAYIAALTAMFRLDQNIHWGRLLLVWYGLATDAGGFFWTGLVIVSVAFLYEHSIVTPHDLSRLNRAFFTVNGLIGIVLFVCALLDLLVRGLTV